jgi:protein-tyrosine phosphatase
MGFTIPFLADITLKDYIGPIPGSNWVLKDKLLVGCYPYDTKEKKNYFNTLLRVGITDFISLQTEGELDRLEPYFPFNSDENQYEKFYNFPIPDRKIVSDKETLLYLKDIVDIITESESVVYLHCLGGHGRTGVLVSLILSYFFALQPEEALDYTQTLHDSRWLGTGVDVRNILKNPINKKNSRYFSPQTTVQIDQVFRLCPKLASLKFEF